MTDHAPTRPLGLVVFDLDGTLTRGPTVCELLAQTLDRSARMAVILPSHVIEAPGGDLGVVARGVLERWS